MNVVTLMLNDDNSRPVKVYVSIPPLPSTAAESIGSLSAASSDSSLPSLANISCILTFSTSSKAYRIFLSSSESLESSTSFLIVLYAISKLVPSAYFFLPKFKTESSIISLSVTELPITGLSLTTFSI